MAYSVIKDAYVRNNFGMFCNIVDPESYRNCLIFTEQVRQSIIDNLFKFPYKITNISFDISKTKGNIACQITVVYACQFRKQNLREMRNMIHNIASKYVTSNISSIDINLMRCPNADLEALYLCQIIGGYLNEGIGHRKLYKVASRAMRAKAIGCLIEIKGRINGHTISRKDRILIGKINRNSVGFNVSYALLHYRTKTGIIGIKVWVNREITDDIFKKNLRIVN